MTKTVELSVAKATLGELIAALAPGDELVVTDNNKPVARLLPTVDGVPIRGRCKGMLTIISEDDEHLEDFKEYMPGRSPGTRLSGRRTA